MKDHLNDKPLTCIVVLYDGQIVSWKANFSMYFTEGVEPMLSSKYYPDYKCAEMRHKWKVFRDGGEERWEMARKWREQFPIHPEYPEWANPPHDKGIK